MLIELSNQQLRAAAGTLEEQLLSTLDPGALAAMVPGLIRAESGAQAVALVLAESLAQQVVSSCADPAGRPPNCFTQRLLLAAAASALQHTEMLMIDRDERGLGADLAPLQRIAREEGLRQLIVLPLHASDHALGALILGWWQESPMTHDQTAAIARSGRLVGMALTNAERCRRAEQGWLRDSAILANLSEATIIVAADSLTIDGMNRAAEDLCGFRAADLSGRRLESLLALARDDRQRMVAGSSRQRLEGALLRRDGTSLPVSIASSEVVRPERTLVLSITTLSEHWRPLNRLMLAERMAAMQRLTAIIAHEINNPLQAIANTLRLLDRPIDPEKRSRYLSMAQVEADRLIALIRRALDLYQPAHEARRALALHPLLESVVDQFGAQLSDHHVTTRWELLDGSPHVSGISGHLREVFLCLVQNAIDAMPSGGSLTIRTRIEAEPSELNEQLVVIEVTDTGPGIPDAQLQQIFEPFHTSRVGAMGMGLPITYSLIEHHAGRVSVSSSDQGSTFRVSLPILTDLDL